MLVYDLEIRIGPPPRNAPREKGIKYVDNWQCFEGMGISVIGAFEVEAGIPHLFMRDNLGAFAELTRAHDYLVGFNNTRFDNLVLAANGINLPRERCYDLLVEIWSAVGLDPMRFWPKTHGGYGLDAVCRANNLGRKSGSGTLAPVLWQTGKYGALMDYCLGDVGLTKNLLDLVVREGRIVDPKTDRLIRVRQPLAEPVRTRLFEI